MIESIAVLCVAAAIALEAEAISPDQVAIVHVSPSATTPEKKERVDDRRVVSGILHMLHTGGRWRDVPAKY